MKSALELNRMKRTNKGVVWEKFVLLSEAATRVNVWPVCWRIRHTTGDITDRKSIWAEKNLAQSKLTGTVFKLAIRFEALG